jgi:ribosomal protein L37AE/L43A
MIIRTNKNALADGTREGIESKLNLTLDGKFKGFDVFNHNENVPKTQCSLCNPTLSKPCGAARLCPTCESAQEKRKAELTEMLTTPPTVKRLDRRCFACNRGLTPSRMASGSIICRPCADELRTKGATAQNNFVEKVKANVGRFLKGVVAL